MISRYVIGSERNDFQSLNSTWQSLHLNPGAQTDCFGVASGQNENVFAHLPEFLAFCEVARVHQEIVAGGPLHVEVAQLDCVTCYMTELVRHAD